MSEHCENLAAGVFHLISAHDVVPRGHLTPTYVALCGARVPTASMPEYTDCPDECECEFSPTMAYCPACLSAATRQNRQAGVEAGDASMVTRGG